MKIKITLGLILGLTGIGVAGPLSPIGGGGTAGGGSSIFPATATASFPYGLLVSTVGFPDNSVVPSGGIKYLMVGQRRSQVDFQANGPKTEDADGYSGYYGLYFLDSADNMNFSPIDAYRAIVSTFPGASMTRDAALFWKNRQFYIQWPHSPIDGKYYDYWKSPDLINWTQISTSVFTVPTVTKVYGSDWFIDPSQNGQIYMIMSPFTTSPLGNFVWWSTPVSGNNQDGAWTTPVRMPTSSGSYLQGYDPTIVYGQGVYWFMDVNSGFSIYSSTSMSGTWTSRGGDTELNSFEGYAAVEISTELSNTYRIWMDPTIDYDLWSAYFDITFTSTFTWTRSAVKYATITPGMKGIQVIRLNDSEAINRVSNAIACFKDQHIEDMVHISTNLSEYAASGNQSLTPQYNWPIRRYTLANPGVTTNNTIDLRVQHLQPDSVGIDNIPIAQDISKRIPLGWTWKFIINTASTTNTWNITVRQATDDDGAGGGTYTPLCVARGTTTAQSYYMEFMFDGTNYVAKTCTKISTDPIKIQGAGLIPATYETEKLASVDGFQNAIVLAMNEEIADEPGRVAWFPSKKQSDRRIYVKPIGIR